MADSGVFPVWGEELENGNAVWLEPPCKMDRQWWQGRSGPCPPIQWWKEVKRTFPSGTQKVGFPDPLLVAMNNALNNLHSNPTAHTGFKPPLSRAQIMAVPPVGLPTFTLPHYDSVPD